MAVYTVVSDEDLSIFLEGYDEGELRSFKGIAEGVENSNFFVQTTKGPLLLTLYEKRVDPNDLPFFLGLMEHLGERGFNCPQPIKNKSGTALGTLSGRPAAMVSFLNGMWVRRPTPDHCLQVGKTLAELHLAAENFAIARKNALSLESWRPLYESCDGKADTIESGLNQEIRHALNDLENNWPDGLPTGVIHADMFADNVFFLKDQLSGVIDFYFACNDMLAYDLAICLNAWCFEIDGSLNVTKAKNLLTGYHQTKPLSQAEQDALPILAAGSALRFLLTRAYDWLTVSDNAMVTKKDPIEYLRKLRFHRTIQSVNEYGWRA